MEKRPTSTVISFGVNAPESYLAFDRAGRPFVFNDRGYTYKRSLDGSLHLRYRDLANDWRERRVLSFKEAKEVLERAYEQIGRARAELSERAEEILRWTPDKLLREEKMRFREVYRFPISILPPDAYLDIVVQATFGCTWNKCTFCSFYKDRLFSKRDEASFRKHVRSVRDFFGQSLSLRRNVFLADGNVLALGEPLLPLMDTVRTFFPGRKIASFLDLWSGYKKGGDWWQTLAERGLSRVSIGLESGSSKLLKLFNKPGEPEEAIELVHALKRAGLAVNIIFLVGAGGRPFREEHFLSSMHVLSKLPLRREDIVYLSPLVRNAELETLDPDLTSLPDMDGELRRWFEGVSALGYKASLYDIREFLY
ncbi:MAG: radical SAM protein [Candidatus Carbobacillus altaicus]|nr:radical SAM protein [Candidatus Carbobacillus altaicus]